MTLSAVLIASLLGSLHCIGMCGGFVMFCAANGGSKALSVASYHLGRLITYLTIGALSGAMGAALDKQVSVIGFQNFSAYFLGSILILWGLLSLRNKNSALVIGLRKALAARFSGAYTGIFKLFDSVSPVQRSLVVGLLSTFLPCGWLYTFAAVALGSGSATSGALTMAVFWIGTLPALITLGGIGKFLFDKLGRYAPTLSAIMIIIAGLISIWTHLVPMDHQHHHMH